MTDAEIKLECLRLAIDLKKAEADRSVQGIADLQKVLYNLVSSEQNDKAAANNKKRSGQSKDDELFS